LVKANDEVIILDPSYDCYEAPILLCNAIPVRISLNDDYTTNWGIIENACSTTTAMIIINNPHNPTGKMLTQSDFEALESLLQKYPKLLSSLMKYMSISLLKKSTYQRIHALNY
jgi:methionine aminotransferase